MVTAILWLFYTFLSEVAKSLLIDMSEGELAKADIEALPFNEFVRLSECVKDFIGIKESD